jgi:peptidyl-prolyl cis-trans isomerase C
MVFSSLVKQLIFELLKQVAIMNRYLMIPVFSFSLVFIITFGLSCRKEPSPETERPEPNTPARIDTKVVESNEPSKTSVDGVAVTVNGVDIMETDIDADFKKMTAQAPPMYVEKNKEKFRQQVLDRRIAIQLIDEKAKATNTTVSDEDVLAQVKEIVAQQKMTVEQFKKILQDRRVSYDEWEEQVRWGVLLGKLVAAEYGDQLTITDADANNFYTANIRQFEAPEQIRASHILIKPVTDPNVDPNEAEAKALAKAQDLLKQIKEGADFAELAKATGGYPSAPNGGDLGYFSRGRMLPAFDIAAFALKVNEVSDVVQTEAGYHIIKVTDKKEASRKTFEQAREEIIRLLKRRKQTEFFQKYLLKLRAGANVVFPPGKEPTSLNPVK